MNGRFEATNLINFLNEIQCFFDQKFHNLVKIEITNIVKCHETLLKSLILTLIQFILLSNLPN